MQIVSKEESICMKCQMLSPWEFSAEHLTICLTFVKKINTVGLKGLGFSQTLQDVFLAVVDLLNIKIF